MSERKAQFPAQVWDGTAADRDSRQIDSGPAYPSYDQIVAEVIATQRYAQGLIGGTTSPYNAEAAENLSEGEIIYIDNTGRLQKAANNSIATAQVAGLMINDTLVGVGGDYYTDYTLELADWSGITGSTDLVPGAIYFLDSTPGKMTTTAPTADGYYVVKIGRAQNTKKFDIEIGPVIRL